MSDFEGILNRSYYREEAIREKLDRQGRCHSCGRFLHECECESECPICGELESDCACGEGDDNDETEGE